MSVRFKVVRLNDKIVKIRTDHSKLNDMGTDPVGNLKTMAVSEYQIPSDVADHHYKLLRNQMG
tara:strand:+ start:2373 stop:2561 length:189 start_codon:yes stop_codon:yes gene_type:complete